MDDRYDLVHANYGLLGPVALSQRRLPVVLTLWGTDLYGPLGPLTRTIVPFCDAVIVMSEGMADEFQRDCDVIPHGIDTERFKPEPQSVARRKVGWDKGQYHVLFPYHPDREVKNYPLAKRTVDAIDTVLEKPVTLRPVWGVSHEKFPHYVNAADCLLMSSKREGSPNAVKEALACNLPVVSTDVGDVGELLAGVEPSAVCDSEAELVGALADVLRTAERSNGREAVENLSLEWMSDRIREVYERVSNRDRTERRTTPSVLGSLFGSR